MSKEIFYPNLYHGKFKRKDYFEGWYFKVVDAKRQQVFAFIPGISYGSSETTSHSFIQLLRGNEAEFNYFKYDIVDFTWNNKKFNIGVGRNSFSLDKMSIDINEDKLKIFGAIYFKNLIKWPDSLISPGSMGYYNFIPFMECYSQVCAIDLDLSGSLNVNGEIIDFNNGKGYIEKNWGKSFPLSWIWVQCNCFKKYKAALSCSIGHIPFLRSSFRGFLIGFLFNNKFYKFTTMNKSTINIVEDSGDVELTIENNRYKMYIHTKTNKERFILCYGPKGSEMIPMLEENLKGIVHLRLFDKNNDLNVFEDVGECTGIEYGGEQKNILDFIH
ncbi:tocopherol cyclase family protein [Candidatus Clostridium stratigraminis]|uniref:Tocopherol cyclase family protein n=1 Tax=Candidatus Clostridium stratigraminis TaxID=3381661 RepID=A0ABW8T4J1_9CLOT